MQQIVGAGESSSQHAFLYVSGIGVPGKMKNNAVPLLLMIYLYYLVFGFWFLYWLYHLYGCMAYNSNSERAMGWKQTNKHSAGKASSVGQTHLGISR